MWGWEGGLHTDTSHQSQCTPQGEPKVAVPPGTCRSSVLGAVIFLPTTNLMTEPRGLITATPPPPPTHLPRQQLHAPLCPRCPTQVSVRGVSAPRLVQSNQPPPSPAPMASGSAFHFEVAQAGLCTSPGPRPAACAIVWPQRKTIISTQFTVSKH